MTYVDKENVQSGQRPFFKQDFVVSVADDGTFISYTSTNEARAANSPYVRSMDDFQRD